MQRSLYSDALKLKRHRYSVQSLLPAKQPTAKPKKTKRVAK